MTKVEQQFYDERIAEFKLELKMIEQELYEYRQFLLDEKYRHYLIGRRDTLKWVLSKFGCS